MPRKVYKTYYRCSTQNTVIHGKFGDELKLLISTITFNGVLNRTDGTYSSAPVWFSHVEGLPVYDTTWSITPPSEEDTEYWFSWTSSNVDGTETEYIVRLVMLDYCELELGCDTGTTNKPLSVLLWLTREGGWCYFPFNGRKTFEVKIPDGKTYVSGEYVMRNTSRRGVYEGEILTTGPIPEMALDLLQSLKESVQVYFVENFLDATGEQIYHPVMLQDGDFTKRKTGDRRFDVTVKFLYAEERQIQTQ